MLSMRFVPEAEVAPDGVRRRKRVPLVVAFEVENVDVVKLLLGVALPITRACPEGASSCSA